MDSSKVKVGDLFEIVDTSYGAIGDIGQTLRVTEVLAHGVSLDYRPDLYGDGGLFYYWDEIIPVNRIPGKLESKAEATKDTNPKDAIGDKKVPLWLLSPIAKAQWAVAQFVGLVKYGAWNWRDVGVRSSIYLSAMQRHMDAYLSGEEFDPIDNTPHLGHIMACAAILIDAKAAGKLVDDRPPSVSLRAAYADVEKQMVTARENYGHLKPRHYTITDKV